MSDRQPLRPFTRQVASEPVALPLAFGDVVRRMRRAAGLSQEALSERATVSWRTISDIERGIERRRHPDTVRLLAEALDLSPQDRAMLEAAARGTESAPPLTALTPLAPAQHNLPRPMTPLIGRMREIATACALLRREDVRLLTITGPGGVGKTRLAIAVATALAAEFADGVHFVPLAAVRDPALMLPAIAQSLGIPETAGRPPRESLVAELAGRRLLLTLDNFEQLTAEAGTIADVLGACPRLTVLVTSRAALRVYGEHEYAIAPLPLPEPDVGNDPGAVGGSPAVELFRQRAAAVRPGFAVTEANARAITEICVRLDGLPLAIELAAARVKLSSPPELLARMHDSTLRLLTGGAQDAPARQRTMRDTIAWSYDLLMPEEQRLLRRLSVFVGGWTLEAAEAVCGGDGVPDVYDGIASLIDKSIVRTREQGESETRFGMLETISEFAWGELAAHGETTSIRQRHLEEIGRLVDAAAPALVGFQRPDWYARLEREMGNIHAGLTWALECDDIETGFHVANALWRFWQGYGHAREGRAWFEAFLERAESRELIVSPALRAEALNSAGFLAFRQRDFDQCVKYEEESLLLFRQLQAAPGMASALNDLGLVAIERGEFEQAIVYLDESIAVYRSLGSPPGTGTTLLNLGRVHRERGEYDRAVAALEEALALSRLHGDTEDIAFTLDHFGVLERLYGDSARAVTFHEESLRICRQIGHNVGIARVLNHLAAAFCDLGERDRAAALLEENVTRSRQREDRANTALALIGLGDVARTRGDNRTARGWYAEGLRLLQEIGPAVGMTECIERMAWLAAAETQAERAARLLGAAAGPRTGFNGLLAPAEQTAHAAAENAARTALGDEVFNAAFAVGLAMSLEEAGGEALVLT